MTSCQNTLSLVSHKFRRIKGHKNENVVPHRNTSASSKIKKTPYRWFTTKAPIMAMIISGRLKPMEFASRRNCGRTSNVSRRVRLKKTKYLRDKNVIYLRLSRLVTTASCIGSASTQMSSRQASTLRHASQFLRQCDMVCTRKRSCPEVSSI